MLHTVYTPSLKRLWRARYGNSKWLWEKWTIPVRQASFELYIYTNNSPSVPRCNLNFADFLISWKHCMCKLYALSFSLKEKKKQKREKKIIIKYNWLRIEASVSLSLRRNYPRNVVGCGGWRRFVWHTRHMICHSTHIIRCAAFAHLWL